MCVVKDGAFQRGLVPPGNLFVPPGNIRSGGRGSLGILILQNSLVATKRIQELSGSLMQNALSLLKRRHRLHSNPIQN